MTGVVIIDYGLSNLSSVYRALEVCGVTATISDDPNSLKRASHIILPGVGSFRDGMEALRRRGWSGPIRDAVSNGETPFLGICLGMQLLAGFGDEGGRIEGLGLIPGEVCRLAPGTGTCRVPHVGWNSVSLVRRCPLFEEVPDCSDFYFVHSYHLVPVNPDHILGTTDHGVPFVSAVIDGNVFGVQFHPEKSSFMGLKVIRNFLSLAPIDA